MKSFDPSEFLTAVRPIAEKVIAETGFTVKRGNTFARALNLAMGHTAKTRAEKEFQDKLLAEIEAAYPDDSGPALHEERPTREYLSDPVPLGRQRIPAADIINDDPGAFACWSEMMGRA